MKGITIMGDMPIYVGYQSADVWANKKQFLLVYVVSVCVEIDGNILCNVLIMLTANANHNWQNKKGFPVLVSGVPPDAFSETGQLWGRCVLYLSHSNR